MLCPYCGGTVPEGSSVCPYCRGRLESAAAQPAATQPATQPAPASHVAQSAPSQHFAAPTTPPPPLYAPQPAPATYAAQPVPVSYAPQQPAPFQQAQPPALLSENPLRAIILAGAFILAMLLLCFIPSALGSASGANGTTYLSVMRLVPLACAVYLIQKDGLRNKLAALIIGFVTVVIHGIAYLAILSAMQISADLGSLIIDTGLRTFFTSLLVFAAVLAAGFVAAVLSRSNPRRLPLLTALGAGGAFFVVQVIAGLIFNFISARLFIALPSTIFGPLPNAVALGLAVVLVFMLSRFKTVRMTTSTGPKVWFWLCVAANALTLLATPALFEAAASSGNVAAQMTSTHLFSLLCPAVGLIGYVYLLRSKRIGFILVLLGCGLSLFGQFGFYFNSLLNGLAMGNATNAGMFSYLGGMASSLAIILNPVITSLVLRRAWKTTPAEPPRAPQQRVPLVFKIAALVTLVLGTVLFLNACVGYFGLLSYNFRDVGVFYGGVVFCGAVAFLGLITSIGCFVPSARAGVPLRVVTLVLGVVFVLFSALILIMGSSPYTGDFREQPRLTTSSSSAGSAGNSSSSSNDSSSQGNSSSSSSNSPSPPTPRAGLPIVFDAYDKAYLIDDLRIEYEDGKTIISCEGVGFDVLPMRNGQFQFPVWCSVIVDGKEIECDTATTGSDGPSYEFKGTLNPEFVVFTAGDDPDQRHEVPLG